MGSKLKTLSGTDVVKIFSSFGFSFFSQRGSHIKLRRFVDTRKETLVIPDHNPIPKGTLKAIYNHALPFIPDSDLRGHFYTE